MQITINLLNIVVYLFWVEHQNFQFEISFILIMNEQILYKHYLERVHTYFRRFIDMSREEFDLIVPYFEIRKFANIYLDSHFHKANLADYFFVANIGY